MASITDIQEKINKVNDDIQKRKDKINKLESKEIKLRDKLDSLGIIFSDFDKYVRSRYSKKPNTFGHYRYDEFSDIVWDAVENKELIQNNDSIFNVFISYQDSIRNQLSSWNKIFDLEDRLTKLESELQRAEVKQKKVTDIPLIIKELQNELYNKLIEQDKKLRDDIVNYFRNFGKTDTIKKYGKVNFNMFINATDKDIEKLCEKDAEYYVFDLIDRVTNKIGKITDYSKLFVNGPAINGRVFGERGSVYLETIIAGGPVQRLHYRVLLKK
jgi:DNA repair exonuclease SbcCD ATPase subunit